MNYKKFTRYSLLATIFLSLIILTFKIVMSNIASVDDKTSWVNAKYLALNFDKFYHKNIIIGASTSMNLDADYLSQKYGEENAFINFSIAGSRLDYVYFLVKTIVENNEKRPQKIYFSLVSDWTKEAAIKCPKEGGPLVKYFLSKENVIELDEISSQGGNCLRAYENTRFLRKYYFDKFNFKAIKTNADLKKELENNNGKPVKFLTEDGDFGAKENSVDYDFNHREDAPRWTQGGESYKIILKKLLELLEKNNIDYEIYFTPHYKEISFFSPDSTNLGYGNYFSLFENIAPQKISNKVLILDNIYFRDRGLHTTLAGTKAFNDYFFDYVVKNKNVNNSVYELDTKPKNLEKNGAKIEYDAKNLASDLVDFGANNVGANSKKCSAKQKGYLILGPNISLKSGAYEFSMKYRGSSLQPKLEGSKISILSSKVATRNKLGERAPRTEKHKMETDKIYFEQKILATNSTKEIFVKIKLDEDAESVELRVFCGQDMNIEVDSISIKKLR